MTPIRLFHRCVPAPALLALLLVCACAGQRSDPPGATPGIAVGGAPPTVPVVPGPANSGAQQLTCKTDADCAVKDVGSCCGYQPRCLNKDAHTFPELVKAQCAKEGRVSHCGMIEIAGCECLEGKCAAVTMPESGGAVQ